MQLLYVWINKYNSLENIGINLTQKHQFNYDTKKNKITYQQNGDNSNFIYNNNLKDDQVKNLRVIVGNNGSGKSSILHFILDEFANYNSISLGGMFIFLDRNKMIKEKEYSIKVYYAYTSEDEDNVKNKPYIVFDKKYKEIFNDNNSSNFIECGENYKMYIKNVYNITDLEKEKQFKQDMTNEMVNTYFIFYSSIFDNSQIKNTELCNISDISTNGMLKKATENNINIENFFYNDLGNQIKFINDYKRFNTHIPFKLPNKVYIGLRDMEDKIKLIIKLLGQSSHLNECEKLLKFISEKQYIYKSREKDCFTLIINRFYLGICISLLSYINNSSYFRNKSDDVLDDLIDTFKVIEVKMINNTYIYKDVCLCIKRLKNKFTNLRSSFEPYLTFARFLDDIYVEGKKNKAVEISESMLCLKINVDNSKYGLTKFWEKCKDTLGQFNYISFYWGLSSGENTLLNIFSRFYSVEIRNMLFLQYAIINKNCKEVNIDNKLNIKDVIILIDEADATLHPEWQRKYIKSILEFTRNIYEGVSLQFIITTHSPIILSDISNENITYLYKDENGKHRVLERDKKTFGANIYNLYSDSFYLKKCKYGIIGDLASENIDNVEKILLKYEDKNYTEKSFWDGNINNDYIEELEYCRKIIERIGEPLISNALRRKYDYIVSKISSQTYNSSINDIKSKYNNLSKEEKEEFIKFIISKEKK